MSSSAVEGLKSRLAAHLTASDGQKSSHWKQYTAGRSVTAQNGIAGIWGFGTRVTRSMHRRAAHFLLQRHLLGWTNPIFRASSYAAASRYCVAQRRVLDMDVLRHCFTVELLKDWQDRLDRPKGLCVIGDGQANLVTATLHARLFPKVLSVNLADVLLNDLEVMLADGLLSDREICLVESVGDLDHFWNDPLIKVGLLCADQADLIREVFRVSSSTSLRFRR